MSDNEEQRRPAAVDNHSESSDEEGSLERGGASNLRSKLHNRAGSPDQLSDEGEDQLIDEGEQATQDSSTTESSAPKIEGVSREAETDSEPEIEKDDEEEEDLKPKQVESSDTEEEEKEEEREEQEDVEQELEQLDINAKAEQQDEQEEEESRAESPAPRSPSPAAQEKSRSPSPVVERRSPSPAVADSRSRSASPAGGERKSSHGSSSFDEERASSMSPEPAAVISTPKPAPVAVTPTANSSQKDITRIYTEALVNEDVASSPPAEKFVRSKPAGDITQIYTASLAKEHASPKLERARGGKPVKDITQLYTAAFNKPDPAADSMPSPNRPRRNPDITKLYTGGFEKENNDANSFRSKPRDEITNPRKHNMATSLDREAIRDAYTQVMSDNNGVEWAAFKFDESNQLVVGGTGDQFDQFKACFGPDDRGFGYIKIQTGDEMSKRARFCLITWVGSNVSVMKKAKMSTDKLLVKEVIQNLSVELQLENSYEFSMDHLKTEVDKAGGARYGTGIRVE